jgi:hypothetical protein
MHPHSYSPSLTLILTLTGRLKVRFGNDAGSRSSTAAVIPFTAPNLHSPLLTLARPILTLSSQPKNSATVCEAGAGLGQDMQRQMQRDNGYLFEIRPVSSPFLTLTHPYPHPVPKAEKRMKSSGILRPSGKE